MRITSIPVRYAINKHSWINIRAQTCDTLESQIYLPCCVTNVFAMIQITTFCILYYKLKVVCLIHQENLLSSNSVLLRGHRLSTLLQRHLFFFFLIGPFHHVCVSTGFENSYLIQLIGEKEIGQVICQVPMDTGSS